MSKRKVKMIVFSKQGSEAGLVNKHKKNLNTLNIKGKSVSQGQAVKQNINQSMSLL